MRVLLTPVSIVIPMRNAATTILETLQSIAKQRYPIQEAIIIDNKSQDDSTKIVEAFAKRSKLPIRLIKRRRNKGVGASFNLGASLASSDYIVFMHSDSSLSSQYEIAKLIDPMEKDQAVIASYSTTTLPKKVWDTYNFWQKCLFAQAVDKDGSGLMGKFDAIRRDIFKRIGGFNDVYFGEDIGIGGEDADLHFRLKKQGKVLLSKAKVIHFHYLGKNYKLSDWIKNRKLFARTYGRLLRVSRDVGFKDTLIFCIKPLLAILPFIPKMFLLGLILIAVYIFLYPRKMYTDSSTRGDPRIFLLPFIHIFLLYYETFWMLQAFFFLEKEI